MRRIARSLSVSAFLFSAAAGSLGGCAQPAAFVDPEASPPAQALTVGSAIAGVAGAPAHPSAAARTPSVESDGVAVDPDVTLVSITVESSADQVPVGMAADVRAVGVFADGTARNVTGDVDWSVDSAAVATIDGDGKLRGFGEGDAVVRARLGDASASLSVTVTPAVVTAIVLSPEGIELASGDEQRLVAMGVFSDGRMEDVSADVVWTSSDPAVAEIAERGGLVQAMGAGSADIAASTGMASASVEITVPQ